MPVIFSELQIASFFSQLFFVFKSNLLDQLFSDGFQVHLHIKLWKKCLNSDSQQFQQYQQNEQLTLTWNHWIQKRNGHMPMDI